VLSELELDFDLEVTGFEMAEIDMLIENLSPAPVGEDDPADALPPPGGPAVTQTTTPWFVARYSFLW